MPQTPTEEVIRMQKEGKDDAEIITLLTKKGYMPMQISEAINQAKIKQTVSKSEEESGTEGMQPSILTKEIEEKPKGISAPSPESESSERIYGNFPQQEQYNQYSGYAESAPELDTEAIEEIAEEIVAEKWDEAKEKISSVVEWKNYAENRLKGMEEKIRRVEGMLDKLQLTLIGKVDEYGQNIKDMSSELQAIEGAFSKIISPLTDNVKELQKMTGKAKEKSVVKKSKK